MYFGNATWKTGTFVTHTDERGSLTPVDLTLINQKIGNFFWISNVTEGATRAGHGHKKSHQLLMVMSGKVDLEIVEPTQDRHLTTLSTASWAYIPPGHTITLKNFSSQTLIGVFASEQYDPGDVFI